MVNPTVAATRNDPEYGLEGVHRLAGFGQVQYMSRRVLRHIENLELAPDDVCTSLCALRESDFHHSECYATDARWHDVYLLPHPTATHPRERLYIKFRVTPDFIWIELCSFHPEGWQ